jgi:membrane-associated protease RseP (regulator of RpoE activity)
MTKKLPIKDQSLIYGAGILANIFFGMFAVALYRVVDATSFLDGFVRVSEVLLVGVTLWFARYIFCSYVIGPFGVWVGYFLFLRDGFSSAKESVSVGNIEPLIWIGSQVNDLRSLLLVSAFISFSLGAINAMPFMPLDGGRIVLSWIKGIEKFLQKRQSPHHKSFTRLREAFTMSGLVIMIFLMLTPVLVDIWKGLKLLF